VLVISTLGPYIARPPPTKLDIDPPVIVTWDDPFNKIAALSHEQKSPTTFECREVKADFDEVYD
jgi:hypothetical protein